MGVVLVHRDVAGMSVYVPAVGVTLSFDVLCVFPFSAEKKRMVRKREMKMGRVMT